jgi:hypothetical protein
MNAENPVQTDLFGVSATRTKDTRLDDHNGGYRVLTPALPLPSVMRAGVPPPVPPGAPR